MTEEILFRRDKILVRRMKLEPGESMPWHRDPFHRVTAILHGERLDIEYKDGTPTISIELYEGQVDWDEPTDKMHRARNTGTKPYEEITIFFLDNHDDIHQPKEDQTPW